MESQLDRHKTSKAGTACLVLVGSSFWVPCSGAGLLSVLALENLLLWNLTYQGWPKWIRWVIFPKEGWGFLGNSRSLWWTTRWKQEGGYPMAEGSSTMFTMMVGNGASLGWSR